MSQAPEKKQSHLNQIGARWLGGFTRHNFPEIIDRDGENRIQSA
jgi:hypothetical protein